MKREFHAEYEMRQATAEGVNRLAQNTSMVAHARGLLLASLRDTRYHEMARSAWQSIGERELSPRGFDSALQTMRDLGVREPDGGALAAMPAGSWLLSLPFRLRKPYISRDDAEFHVLDNPIRKEKVFQVPTVAASSWKGSLHATALRWLVPRQAADHGGLFRRRARLVRLFGSEEKSAATFLDSLIAGRLYGTTKRAAEIGEEFTAHLKKEGYLQDNVEGRRGRLEFFSSFFNAVGYEVINPHARDRKVGRNPILFECVPRGTAGRFDLAYVPFGAERAAVAQQAASDFDQCFRYAIVMLTAEGFGAKTSSGFGVADRNFLPTPGSLHLRQRTGVVKIEIASFDVKTAVDSAKLAFAGVEP
jgi:CRISPR/Cas system CMR subunit Cmr6 (Cas7 group RAMP superfamily)